MAPMGPTFPPMVTLVPIVQLAPRNVQRFLVTNVPLATNGTIGKISNGTNGRIPNAGSVCINTYLFDEHLGDILWRMLLVAALCILLYSCLDT